MDCMPLKVNYIFQMFDFTLQSVDLEKSWMAPVSLFIAVFVSSL